MKNILWIFCFLPLSILAQAPLAGSWLLPEQGVRLTLSQADAQGRGQYLIEYSNGFSNQNSYWLQQNQITFAAFNYGQNQTFTILQLTQNSLSLQSDNPPQSFQLQRENGTPAQNTLTMSSASMSSGAALASQNGYTFTEAHWQAALQFAEFVLGSKLAPADEEAFKQATLADFRANPQASISEIENLTSQMQQFYQLSDLGQIALSRNMLLASLYQNMQQLPQKPYFYQLMQSYAPAIQFDPATGLLLSWRDVDGFMGVVQFYAELAGQPMQFTQEDRMAYAQYLGELFNTADPQTKASICIMATLNEYLRSFYAQLSPAERQQWAAQLLQNNSYQQGYAQDYSSYGNPQNSYGSNPSPSAQEALQQMQTKLQLNDMMFNTMQNIMLNQHATSLNIIENMGSSGNYWEVVDNNY